MSTLNFDIRLLQVGQGISFPAIDLREEDSPNLIERIYSVVDQVSQNPHFYLIRRSNDANFGDGAPLTIVAGEERDNLRTYSVRERGSDQDLYTFQYQSHDFVPIFPNDVSRINLVSGARIAEWEASAVPFITERVITITRRGNSGVDITPVRIFRSDFRIDRPLHIVFSRLVSNVRREREGEAEVVPGVFSYRLVGRVGRNSPALLLRFQYDWNEREFSSVRGTRPYVLEGALSSEIREPHLEDIFERGVRTSHEESSALAVPLLQRVENAANLVDRLRNYLSWIRIAQTVMITLNFAHLSEENLDALIDRSEAWLESFEWFLFCFQVYAEVQRFLNRPSSEDQ